MNIILNKNGGENMEQQKQEIKGWFLTGTSPHNYEMGLDTKMSTKEKLQVISDQGQWQPLKNLQQ